MSAARKRVMFFIGSELGRGCDGNAAAMSSSDSQVHKWKKSVKTKKKKSLHIVSQRLASGSAVFPTSSKQEWNSRYVSCAVVLSCFTRTRFVPSTFDLLL